MKRKPHKPASAQSDAAQEANRPFWSGTITFGLVSIPVDLFPATRDSHIGLRMLNGDGQPLHRRYFSEKSDRELDDSDLVSGYEIKKGKYVEVTDEEMERLAPEKTRDINLERFVAEASIPPLYFEHAYFLAPSGASLKSYRLLAAVMQKTGQAGIATFVMRGKEYLVAIFAENGVLRATTMRFQDEVRSVRDVGLPKKAKAAPATVRKLEKAIQARAKKTLTRSALHDEQAAELERYARKKWAKRKDVAAAGPAAGFRHDTAAATAEVVDIMSVLKKSLERKSRSAA